MLLFEKLLPHYPSIDGLSIVDKSYQFSFKTMKRKRTCDHMQAYDLVLTDANGRSVRAHRALLMNKSDYFARLLDDHNLKELQLNENYLIELINYLYYHDSDSGGPSESKLSTSASHALDRSSPRDNAIVSTSSATKDSMLLNHEDIEVLMRLLMLSRKYDFKQLYRSLLNEINFKLGPATAITVYKGCNELGIDEFLEPTKLMILSWLPHLQTTEEFLYLPETAIRDIFGAEEPEIESESKLDALSAWWSHNKQANMTDLWARIMMST